MTTCGSSSGPNYCRYQFRVEQITPLCKSMIQNGCRVKTLRLVCVLPEMTSRTNELSLPRRFVPRCCHCVHMLRVLSVLVRIYVCISGKAWPFRVSQEHFEFQHEEKPFPCNAPDCLLSSTAITISRQPRPPASPSLYCSRSFLSKLSVYRHHIPDGLLNLGVYENEKSLVMPAISIQWISLHSVKGLFF